MPKLFEHPSTVVVRIGISCSTYNEIDIVGCHPSESEMTLLKVHGSVCVCVCVCVCVYLLNCT